MSTKSISDLIDQGYRVIKMDDKWSGEVWHLPADLRTNFDNAFANLRQKQADCDDARIAKETATKKENASRSDIEHTLAKLKQFIRAVANKALAADMFHALGMSEWSDVLTIVIE